MALVQAKYRGNDPWEKPLRYIKADKLKRYDGSEKEARLLVACWQGRDDEVQKIFDSGKPAARIDLSGNVREEHEYRARGRARRSATKISVPKFIKDDLYRFGTPLHKAALRGDAKICEILIGEMNPAQMIDDKTEAGNTPLHNAAYRGSVECCEIILDALADVQVMTGKKGQKLEAGDITTNASLAILNCRNRFLSTPKDKAVENNQRAVVALLENWAGRLKRRNDMTDALRKACDKHVKDLSGVDLPWLRSTVKEAERLGRPSMKKEVLSAGKHLLMRAENAAAA